VKRDLSIDYRCEDRKKVGELRGGTCSCHVRSLVSPFQETPIIIPKNQTVQPGDTFEDTDFKPGFEIVKF
jgi:hypothetical protein